MFSPRACTLLVSLMAMTLLVTDADAQRDNSRTRQSPNAAVSQTIGTTEIEVTYGRPGVKGRTVFGDLQPWGEVWRAGANEPTTLTPSGPVEVNGQRLEQGTYNLFIRPNETGRWDVILTTPVRWGTMFSDATPVLEVQALPSQVPAEEWLSYTFSDLSDTSATLVMRWSDVAVPLTITVPE